MLLLPMYDQVLIPNMGPMTNPSMLKFIIKETQQNPYIIGLGRQRKVNYLYDAGTSPERTELLSKGMTIHPLPKN